MRSASSSVAAVSLALVLVGCGAVDDAEEAEQTTSRGEPLDVRPGDRIDRLGVSVIAPDPGYGVWTEAILDTGETRSIRVQTLADATVYLFLDDEEHDPESDDGDEVQADAQGAAEATAANGSPGPCSDGAYKLAAYRWTTQHAWWFNAGTTPSEIGKNGAEAALKKAAANITTSRNSCGMADQVSATHVYKGRTSTSTQVTADGGCKNGDGKNVVGFGDLPAGYLGIACVWFDGEGHALEADVRLNKADHTWVVDIGAGCNNRWSVEAVATHERGHVFGLNHVSEAAHGNLTMSPAINGPCQNAEATLGRGDVKALRARY